MGGRALVLGSGGFTGLAWELGILAGLAERGIDLHDADLVVGTSAGSVAGALVTSGTDLEELYAGQLAPPDPDEQPVRLGLGTILRWGWAVACSRDPLEVGARVGRIALAAATMSEAARREVIEAQLEVRTWPEQAFLVTAVDAESGEFVVFGRGSRVGDTAVSLLDALAASCAVPGVWAPPTIGGRRWIDGGVRSPTNADLAAGHERIVVLAPITRGFRPTARTSVQVAALREQSRVMLVTPDAIARRSLGLNMLDLARRASAARAGRAQAGSITAQVSRMWLD